MAGFVGAFYDGKTAVRHEAPSSLEYNTPPSGRQTISSRPSSNRAMAGSSTLAPSRCTVETVRHVLPLSSERWIAPNRPGEPDWEQ